MKIVTKEMLTIITMNVADGEVEIWDGHGVGQALDNEHDGDRRHHNDCRGRGDEVWVGQGRHLGKSLRRHIPGDRATRTAKLKLNLCENSIKCQYSSYTRHKTQNHTFQVTTPMTPR